jgi:hypothetical protein
LTDPKWPSFEKLLVTDSIGHAVVHERGTRKLPPRPFLQTGVQAIEFDSVMTFAGVLTQAQRQALSDYMASRYTRPKGDGSAVVDTLVRRMPEGREPRPRWQSKALCKVAAANSLALASHSPLEQEDT